jgi:hypothetical protein
MYAEINLSSFHAILKLLTEILIISNLHYVNFVNPVEFRSEGLV